MFDEERALFAQERALWEAERQALHARIGELEGVPSGWGSAAGAGKATADDTGRFGPPRPALGVNGSRTSSRQASRGERGEKFWEGSSSRHGSVASRAFPEPDDARLPSIAETSNHTAPESGPPSARFASRSPERSDRRVVSSGIDISVIRDDLDGISLKPSALPAALVAKVHSPSDGGGCSCRRNSSPRTPAIRPTTRGG